MSPPIDLPKTSLPGTKLEQDPWVMVKFGLIFMISVLVGASSFADTCKPDLNRLAKNDYASFFQKFSQELNAKVASYNLTANDLENATITAGKSVSNPEAGNVYLLSTPTKRVLFFEYKKGIFKKWAIASEPLSGVGSSYNISKNGSGIAMYRRFSPGVVFNDSSIINIDFDLRPVGYYDHVVLTFSDPKVGQAIQKLKQKGQINENGEE